MLELSTTAPVDAGEVKRITIFTIDAREYTIPEEVDAGVLLALLEAIRSKGELMAAAELFEQLLGAEGYAALRNYRDAAGRGISLPQLKQLIDDVQTLVMGQAEKALGN